MPRAWLIATALTISLCWAQVASPNDLATSACQTQAAATSKPINKLQTPTLLYSVTDLSCNYDSGKYGGDNELACRSLSDKTYSRFVVSIPSRSDLSFVTSLTQNVSFLGLEESYNGKTSGSFCLPDATACGSTPCSIIQPITLQLASSPVRLAYTLIPVDESSTFSFLPVDLFGLNVTDNCASYFASLAALTGMNGTFAATADVGQITSCSYNAGVISALFNDSLNLNASCGIYSDPTTGLVNAQQCRVACVANVTSNTTSEHRRWLAGPPFYAYRVQTRVEWNSVLAVSVTIGTTQRTILIPSVNSNTVMLSDDGLVRVSIAGNYLSELAQDARFVVDGYVFVANYIDNPDAGNSINQGIFNPYLNISNLVAIAKQRAGNNPFSLLTATESFFSRAGLTPAQIGSGKVPTFRSTGSVSFFYIPTALARTKGNQYTQTQDQLLKRLLDTSSSSGLDQCNSGNLAACWNSIPGWAFNSSGAVISQSLCQISNGLNAYSAQYMSNLASGMSAAASVPPGPPPLGLFPGYTIEAPNVWVNDGQVLVDPGAAYNVTAVFSVAIDVANALLTYVDGTTGVVLTTPNQGCIAYNQLGTGLLVVGISNLNPYGSGSIKLTLSANCSIFNGNVTGDRVYANYTLGPPTLIIPAQSSVASGPFALNFTAYNNGTVVCSITATYPAAFNLAPVFWSNFTCASVTSLQQNGGTAELTNPILSWGAGTISILVIAAVVLVAILVAIIVVVAVKAKK